MLKETENFASFLTNKTFFCQQCACDQDSLGSKPTRAILWCPCKRHFAALSPSWQSWQAVLNFSHICIKLKNQNN